MTETPQDPTILEVLEELVSTTAIQNAELEALKAQVAAQTDKLAEVKRHGEAVRKSVSWDNLGERVFEGVAGAVLHKIEDVTKSARSLVSQAESLKTTIITQKETNLRLQSAGQSLKQGVSDVEMASQNVRRASEGVAEARKRDWLHSAVLCAITACMALFGGYWWASAHNTKMSYVEMRTEMTTSYGEDYCGYAGGQVMQYGTNGTYCAVLMQKDTSDE